MDVLYASFDEVPAFKGASTHILANCRALCQQHSVALYTLGETQLPDQENFRHYPIPLQERNYLRRGNLFRKRISNVFSKSAAQVIQFRTPWEGLPAVRSTRPTVYEVNGFPSIELPHYYPKIPNSTIEKIQTMERECVARADVIVCHSERTIAFVRNHFSPTCKILYLPNGYYQSKTEPTSGVQSPVLSLVYLGTLAPWQGVLWCLPTLKRTPSSVKLDIFSQARKAQVKHLARVIRRFKLERKVTYRGPLAKYNLRSTLSNYDLGIAPFLKDRRNTLQGCCPIKLLDYKNAGLPILTSSLSISRPFIEEKIDGFLFRANSRRAFLASILTIAEDKSVLKPMRKRSYESLQNFPSWHDTGHQLVNAITELAAE